MSEEPKRNGENASTDPIFNDLVSETRISSLNISEPEFDSFDVQSVIEQAREYQKKESRSQNIFGKRRRRNTISEPEVREDKPEEVKPASAPTVVSNPAVFVDEPFTSADIKPAVVVEAEEPEEDARQYSYQELTRMEEQEKKNPPKTFAEILRASSNQPAKTKPASDTLPETLIIQNPLQDVEFNPDENAPIISSMSATAEITPVGMEEEEEEKPIRVEEEKEDVVYDPEASLVDDYAYDEYEDNKRFLLSDYRKIEEYLNDESQQGFHYTHHEGHHYYFVKGRPHNYYYKVLYFSKEPDDDYWQSLEKEGWKRMDTQPSRHKKDVGWVVVRNEKKEGELSKDIDNEKEKYRYFNKFSSSCRSTMFLLFIVMVCSAIACWLQYEFQGFLAVMIASGVLFVIALWMFLVYARMLRKSRKQASLLSARIRLAEDDPEYQALRHAGESDADLENDWDNIGKDDDDDEDDDDWDD